MICSANERENSSEFVQRFPTNVLHIINFIALQFDLNFLEMGINLQKADLIKFTPGVCFVFIVGGCFVMLISTILAGK